MLKKALLAGVLGVFLASGVAMAGPGGGQGGGCPSDNCEVKDPMKIEYGMNVKVDLDVCLDWGNLNDDFWSAQANVYQEGQGNTAMITQTDTSQLGAIAQLGNNNYGVISQSGSTEFALIGQYGDSNSATITQTLDNAAAAVIQIGSGNIASVNQ